jgi:DNA-binding response OmpR family regulator
MAIMNTASILLFEKDRNLRHSITLILQRAGYSVIGTDRLEKSEDLLRSGTYALLILDLDMAESRQVLPHLRDNIYHGLAIMILTDQSISAKEHENVALKLSYLVKPIAPETLLDRVGKILTTDYLHPGKNPNYMNSPVV